MALKLPLRIIDSDKYRVEDAKPILIIQGTLKGVSYIKATMDGSRLTNLPAVQAEFTKNHREPQIVKHNKSNP